MIEVKIGYTELVDLMRVGEAMLHTDIKHREGVIESVANTIMVSKYLRSSYTRFSYVGRNDEFILILSPHGLIDLMRRDKTNIYDRQTDVIGEISVIEDCKL